MARNKGLVWLFSAITKHDFFSTFPFLSLFPQSLVYQAFQKIQIVPFKFYFSSCLVQQGVATQWFEWYVLNNN